MEPAKKVRVCDIVGGKFFRGGESHGGKPRNGRGASSGEDIDWVVTPLGEKVSRVNIVGTVVDKFLSEDGRYAALTVDDGSGAIRIKAFGEDVKIFQKFFEDFKTAGAVLAIGSVKEYSGEIYVRADVLKKAGPGNEVFRRLELLDGLVDRKKVVEKLRQMAPHATREALEEYAKRLGIDRDSVGTVLETALRQEEVDYTPRILEIIKSLDSGEGAEISKIFEFAELPDSATERAVNRLFDSGKIYEPSPGRLRVI
jgi:RPA family protein